MSLASCTKEPVSPTGTIAANAVNVTPRVQAFVAAENDPARSKSNGTFSADSAIWYLEAGLNPDYAVENLKGGLRTST